MFSLLYYLHILAYPSLFVKHFFHYFLKFIAGVGFPVPYDPII